MPKFLNTVDLQQNQIINIVLDRRTTAPASPVEGQMYYNETSDFIYYYNGITWINISGALDTLTQGEGINLTGSAENPIINVKVDGASIEIDSITNAVRIKDGGVTTAKLADGNVTSIKIMDKNVTFSKIQDIPTMTVIGRTAGGTGVASAITILNAQDMVGASDTNLATAGSIKAYVDATVAGLGTLQGGVNATTATLFPGGTGVKKGDYWYVTVSGTIQGIVLNVGDVMIANKLNPSTTSANDWIFLETNRDQASTTLLGLVTLATASEVQSGTDANKVITPATLSARTATEARTGLIEIATQTETNDGTDDTRAVTPLKLKAAMDSRVGGYSALIGNGTNTSFTITHNLNTLDVISNIIEVSSGAKILTDVSHTSVNALTVSFSLAPTANQFKIIIKK